ncbi:MAG: thioesterase superfamily protein [Actinomycetia bacterium]|nr:thioesterase superfamily protein [Actinomycetes bacterium]
MESQGFEQVLGLVPEQVTADEVILRLPLAPTLMQPYGIVHGGVWCAVVETAASLGAEQWWGDRGTVVGVSNHTNFLRAVREGDVTARATPLHRGRLQQLWTVEVRDRDERLVARGEVRLQNLAHDHGFARASPGPDPTVTPDRSPPA